MKYCFEKYEFSNQGKTFLGYLPVDASSNEEAKQIAQDKVGDSVVLTQIYIPQEQ